MKKTFCITALDNDLPGVVSRKEKDGFECYGDPVKILGGFSVQQMVEVVMQQLKIECGGCGQEKTHSSFVCCDECWERLPSDIRAAFLVSTGSCAGPAQEEIILRQWLLDNQV